MKRMNLSSCISGSAPILLIEDDPDIVELLSRYLRDQGYEVVSASNSVAGLELLRSAAPKLVILDVMLPGQDGFAICRAIRHDSEIPVIILTARGNVTDRIVGLELGADDYLAKPFEPRELLVRMQTILRRTSGESTRAGFQGLSIDPGQRAVVAFGDSVELSSTEFEALHFLALHPGQAMHRDQLLDHLRGAKCETFSRSIDTLISRLRGKLKDDPQRPRIIKTVWGRGYVLIAPAQLRSDVP